MSKLEQLYRELLVDIGEDPDRQGLRDTPRRAAKAMKFLTRGYDEDIDKLVNNALFDSTAKELVIVKNIELYSMCEHHLLPFIGKAHVGYIPNGKVIGLSKVARLVDAFGRRLQIQEELTRQIAETIRKYTGAIGVGVVIEAKHLCMMMRGVEKQNSMTTTSAFTGVFKQAETRNEFLRLLNGKH